MSKSMLKAGIHLLFGLESCARKENNTESQIIDIELIELPDEGNEIHNYKNRDSIKSKGPRGDTWIV